jgi:hypothetical protein
MHDQFQGRGWLRHYPETLPPDAEVPALTGLDMRARAVEQKPHRPAWYHFDPILTYGELDTRVSLKNGAQP